MALDPKEMEQAILKNLESKTGHGLTHWLSVVEALSEAGTDKKSILTKLKQEYSLGHIQAQTIIGQFFNNPLAQDQKSWTATQLFKDASALATFEAVRNQIMKIDHQITQRPCKTYVPYYAKHQFALVTYKQKQCWLAIAYDLLAPGPEWQQAIKLGGSDRIKWYKVIDGPLSVDDIKLVIQAFEQSK